MSTASQIGAAIGFLASGFIGGSVHPKAGPGFVLGVFAWSALIGAALGAQIA